MNPPLMTTFTESVVYVAALDIAGIGQTSVKSRD
jgi:hypothetical protein